MRSVKGWPIAEGSVRWAPVVRFLTTILRHPITRTVAVFQLGSVGAMFVQAVAGVVVARLVGPAEYGRYAIVMSMAAIGSVLLGAGAADAMAPVLTRAHHSGDDDGVRDAMLFLGKFVLATASVVLLVGLLMPTVAGHLYGDRMLGWYGLAVLTASALSTLLLTPTQVGLQVFGRIGSLSLLTFADQTVRQAFVVGLACAGLGVLGASYGHLFGAVIVLGLSGLFWRRLRAQWPLMPSIRSLWHEFPMDGRRHISSALWVLADRNLALLYSAAPIAISALYLTTVDVSYFKIALGWVTLALAVLSPISILLNTELARLQVQQPERLRLRFIQISLAAVACSTFVTVVAALIARPVFGVLYGSAYAHAAPLVAWLIPFGIVFGLGVALGPMWRAINRVRVSILINVIVLSVGTPLAVVALHQWGAMGAIGMVTGWYAASHIASFTYLVRALGRPSM